MPQFRKKPVEIEAMQFDGSGKSARAIVDWILDGQGTAIWEIDRGVVIIHTLEGDMMALANDWVIRGVKGEFYPCKPDIFRDTYEPVK